MDWVPLADYENGLNLDDKPRKLTDKEIFYITEHFPTAPSADSTAAEVARQEIVNWLVETLKEIKLAPSAIPELIQRILEQHQKSLVVPGTPVGITAAEAVGATTTQMTLNSVAPWEQILIQNHYGDPFLFKIGEWIDSMLEGNIDKIKHIPENRTQYLELANPVTIATTDENGKVSWEKVTAVTKHLPVGDMVKIVTKNGREVTVTQSKSLLVWNESKFIQTEGKNVKIGDKVPVFAYIPEPDVMIDTIDMNKFLLIKDLLHGECGYMRKNVPAKINFDKEFGQLIGIYLAKGFSTDTYIGINDNDNKREVFKVINKWCSRYDIICNTTAKQENNITINIRSIILSRFFNRWIGGKITNKIFPAEILLGNREFIIGILDGFFMCNGFIGDRSIHVTSGSKDIITGISFLCTRLNIFGKQSRCYNRKQQQRKTCHIYTISGGNVLTWENILTTKHNMNKQHLINDEKLVCKCNDVILDPIISVEFVSATEYVYDLTVPSTTNFSIWNGLGIADTFHASGSSKSASFGIDAMKDIIFARKNPKNEICTIYFTNKRITYEEVLDSRQYIVGSMVSDFIKDHDIDSPDVLQRYWWHNTTELLLGKKIPNSTKVLRLFLNVPEMYKHKVTIKTLADVLEREIPPSAVAIYGPIGDGIIDIYPHPTIINETLKKGKEKDLVPDSLIELTYLETIVWPELENIRVKGIAGIKDLIPLVSPVWRIVLLERKITEQDITDDKAKAILGRYVADGSGWILYYNPTIINLSGVVPENLAALCNFAGITIAGGNSTYLIISMPNDRFRTGRGEIVIDIGGIKYRKLNNNIILRRDDVVYREIEENLIKETPKGWAEEIDNKVFININPDDIYRENDKIYLKIANDFLLIDGDYTYEKISEELQEIMNITELKPSEYITNKVTLDKQIRNAEIKRQNDENVRMAKDLPEEQRKNYLRKPINVPRTQLMEAAEFVIAEAHGANLKELLALPNVDKTRTTCNNMYTITSTLGVEAARTFIIRALNNTISNTGSYVHPMNIMFIAEFITSRGEPYGATYTGISRQPGGHLSLATLERAGKVFAQNALHGRKEDIRNVSASVAVGARMAIGDGSFDIAQDIIENGVQKTILNDDLFTAFNRDDEIKKLMAQRNIVQTHPETIPQEDLPGGIDLIKTITLGGTFDYTGAEDETNLITAFNPGEIISTVTSTTQPQAGTPHKMVRRIQTTQPKTPPAQIEIPSELVDVLTQIKVGVPIPESTEAEKITIQPLESGAAISQLNIEPIISTGLIPFNELIPQTNEPIPQGLENLLQRYRAEIQQLEDEPQNVTSEIEDLPRMEIPQLPDLTNINLNTTRAELRREQVRDLNFINTSELQEFINK